MRQLVAREAKNEKEREREREREKNQFAIIINGTE